MLKKLLAISLLIIVSAVASAYAESGRVRVVDGDTIEFDGGSMVRLFGIDAPEKKQNCVKASRVKWLCGKSAADSLKELVGGRVVKCTIERKPDIYGRELAICYVGEININSWLVRNGHAEAVSKYSKLFVPDEIEATRLKIGIWQGPHVSPYLWRKGVRE